MKLVVGLGNPGTKYERTRHNAGFWWVERLAQGTRATLRNEGKFHGRVARLAGPAETWLLLPATYMNESGRAVAALATFYKIEPPEILVVHDELDFAPGVTKLKRGGGVAGHNGLRDVADQLGTQDYWRLRIGIGHPGDKNVVADYVLSSPPAPERELIESAIARCLEVSPLLLAGDMHAAMLKLHTKPEQEGPDGK